MPSAFEKYAKVTFPDTPAIPLRHTSRRNFRRATIEWRGEPNCSGVQAGMKCDSGGVAGVPGRRRDQQAGRQTKANVQLFRLDSMLCARKSVLLRFISGHEAPVLLQVR